jgi:hypothetical protein
MGIPEIREFITHLVADKKDRFRLYPNIRRSVRCSILISSCSAHRAGREQPLMELRPQKAKIRARRAFERGNQIRAATTSTKPHCKEPLKPQQKLQK